MGTVISLNAAREARQSKVIVLEQVKRRALYRGMGDIEEATAALYSAAKYLETAGRAREAQSCRDINEMVVEVRRVLPQGLGPQAA
jgi:hypothetical protein